MILISYLLLCIASFLQGSIDAILYSRKGADAFPWNEHVLLVAMRTTWFVLIASGLFLNYADLVFLAIAFVFSYSFWHNGIYFITKIAVFSPGTRNKFEYFFQDKSKTDTSRNNYDFASRLYMWLFGLLVIFIPVLCQILQVEAYYSWLKR